MTPGRKPLELTAATAADFKNLYLDTDIGRLDCLSHIEGIGGYERVKQASERIEIEGAHLRVLTIDSLIAAKQAMHRPRDKEAVRQLEAIKKLRHETL
jgi:predicted nucleotidyltransferase